MSELSALKVGCGKFFYGKNVLSQLPDEILRLGWKSFDRRRRTRPIQF